MKNPWRNPLKPLGGCVLLLTIIASFLYYHIAEHPDYRSENCEVYNDDYVFTVVLCDQEWVNTIKVCDYYKSISEQGECTQLSMAHSMCHQSGLRLLNTCEN